MRLDIRSGPLAGRSVELGEGLVVGRDPGCDLVLDDDRVSRRHCRFTPQPDGTVLVEDLGSSNGTFVQGEMIAGPVVLRPGEDVRVGGTVLRAEGERAAQPTVVAGPPPTVVGAPQGLPARPRETGRPPPSPPWWRRHWRALAVLAALLVAGGIAGGVLAATLGGEDEEPASLATEPPEPSTAVVSESRETEPPSETGTFGETGADADSFPSTAEAALLERVPESDRASCSRPSIPADDPLADPSLGALAIVLCVLPNGVSSVYVQMDSAGSMNAAYDRLGVAGTPRDTGDCSQAVPAEQSYTVGGETVGRLTCFERDAPEGGRRLLFWWTHDPTTILSFAYRSDGDLQALYEWWANEAGPV